MVDLSNPYEVVALSAVVATALSVGIFVDRFFAGITRHTHGTSQGKLLLTRRLFQGVIFVVALLLVLFVLNVDVSGLAAGIGVGALVLSILLQDLAESWFAGILIMGGKVYRIGDSIQVGDLTGVVTEVTARTTHLKTYDRNEIILPNVNLLRENIINLTGGKKETVASVFLSIDYTFDTDKAKDLILKALGANPRVVIDEPRKREVRFVVKSDEWATRLEVLFWIDEPENQPFILSEVHQAVRKELLAAGILPPIPMMVRDRFLPKGP